MRRRLFTPVLAAGAALAFVLAFCSTQLTASAQSAVIGPLTQSFTGPGSPGIRACGLKGQNSVTFQETGTPGPTDVSVGNDGVNWTPTVVTTMAGATQSQPFTPTVAVTYQGAPTTADCVLIAPDSTWGSQVASVTYRVSSSIAALPGPAGPPGAAGPQGTMAPASPVPTAASGNNFEIAQTGATTIAQPGGMSNTQNNAAVPILTAQEGSSSSTSDLADFLGNAAGTCSPSFTAIVCIKPSTSGTGADQIGLAVFGGSSTGSAQSIYAAANGDALYMALMTLSGYGLDVAATDSGGALVGPMARFNNGYYGSSILSAGLLGWQMNDAGATADDIQVQNEKTTGNVINLTHNFSTYTGTFLRMVGGASGSSVTNPTPTQGTFTGKYEDYFNNSTGSAVEEHSLDSAGDEFNNGQYRCGVANTTNCVFALQSGTSTSTKMVFNTITTCAVNSNHVFDFQVNSVEKVYSDCLGDLTATTSFNVGGSTITPCGFCIGTSGNVTANIMAYGAGAAVGTDTLSTTASGITIGSQTVTGTGLAITNSVGGLIDVFDSAGSLGIAGDLSAVHSVRSGRSVIGGFATAVAPITANYGDVEGSRSVTTGNLNLGGTTTSCNIDEGITTAGVLTSSCQFNVPNLTNTGLGSATVSPLCGASATNESQCTVNLITHAYKTTLTSASGCTALTQCGTFVFNFPTAYAASPFCSAPGIQDTTTPADLWVGDIDAVGASSITYSYATLITLAGTKNLTVTFTCGSV